MTACLLSEGTKKRPKGENTTTISKENGSLCDKLKPKKVPLQSFLAHFSMDIFRNKPDRCRKQIYDAVNEQFHRAQATIGILRYIDPKLNELNRQLGFLNMKCRTYYNRFAFNKELRKHADQVLGNFDLSLEKTIDEVVSEAPPLLKDSLRLYHTRWRKAIATSKWQQDIDQARETMRSTIERYKKYELELEAKRIQLEIYEKIRDIKEELDGMSNVEKLQKIERIIGEVLSHSPIKDESDARNESSLSDDSSESTNSSNWDDTSPVNH